MPRVMEITTPLGPDVLLFKTLTTTESLGHLYQYTITAFSFQSDIDPNTLVGKPVTVNLELPDGGTRYFNGYVTSFSWIGMEGRYHKYKLIVHPWLQFLTYTADCRIFQNLSVVDIIKEIFNDYSQAKFEVQLTESYQAREYCVQYRETDFNFISRLMEEEGIYYYFKHEADSHTLVLADSISAHDVYANYESIPFIPQHGQRRPEQERIGEWDFTQAIQTGRYVIDHYDFKKPSVELQSRAGIKREHTYEDYECYDYPACYVDRNVGEKLARIRIEEQQANFQSVAGKSNARGLSVGYLFTLTNHPRNDQNCEYLIRETIHELDYGSYETSDTAPNYECSFKLIQSKQPYRSTRIAKKTRVQGPQTAIVVGPLGDEIYTDQYGRIKVQFHWDREGKQDAQSSCWIRVSHPWAGKGWGMVAIPRIGQEVIVDFLEGDPDQPVITGRLYNAEQMPPYALPGSMTQSGILSRSTKTGNASNANEFRFEDKLGQELVFLHAEKNMTSEVEVNDSQTVGANRSISVGGTHTENIKKDMTINVTDGKQEITVMNDIIITTENGAVKICSPKEITLLVGSSTIMMTSEHIVIDSPRVDINPGSMSAEGPAKKLAQITFAGLGGGNSSINAASEPIKTPSETSKGTSPASKNTESKKVVKTGLGNDVDQLAAKSPSLQKDIDTLQKKGWQIEYGPAGKGTLADRNSTPPKIVVDSNQKNNPTSVVQSLSHEVGHATYNYNSDVSSKAAYVNGALADEGAATMNNIKVQREIIANGGSDIGIAGNTANHAAYNKAYDQFLTDGKKDLANKTIGSIFGAGEKASVASDGKIVPYNDYYGNWYDKTYPPKK